MSDIRCLINGSSNIGFLAKGDMDTKPFVLPFAPSTIQLLTRTTSARRSS